VSVEQSVERHYQDRNLVVELGDFVFSWRGGASVVPASQDNS